jgi:hypothetical protein
MVNDGTWPGFPHVPGFEVSCSHILLIFRSNKVKDKTLLRACPTSPDLFERSNDDNNDETSSSTQLLKLSFCPDLVTNYHPLSLFGNRTNNTRMSRSADAAVGMMDSAYFVGRAQLLSFFNDVLDLNLTKIEQTASGAVACQITEIIFPGSVPMSRVNWEAK